ncbi:hypothetical protein G3I34_30800 [Streptomyces sp. SID8014]|uniref:restriction endonuclease subunit S n=1 Tax=Streptomyces sp. SID8014 TaxID=2706097 RepID=UPI0013B823D1|nr:restriction endonuclease subunit S [Streptomyces sp. SID8014]NEC16583.1 hypothetical protein [Streptomyces sp. SID8014]
MINMGELFRYPMLREVEMARVEIDYGDRERYLVDAGDLLFARRSLTVEGAGKCAIVASVDQATTWEGSIIRARLDRSKADPFFYFYYFLSQVGRRAIEGIVEQVAAAGIRGSDLRELRVLHPVLAEQRAIAGVLGALDDKIAVNERIAATSLELASSRYRVASQSEAWGEISLGEAAQWKSGGTPKTSCDDYWGGSIPWISALSLKSPWIDSSDRNVTELGAMSGTRLVPADTILFVVRGSSLKEEFRIGITQQEVAFGQDCKALTPISSIHPHVLFHAIRSRSDEILGLVDETSIGAGRLATDLLSGFRIRVPGRGDEQFAEEMRTLDDLAASRQVESRTLATLRDTLLPQLMSGRLRVKDAEKIVEDHV